MCTVEQRQRWNRHKIVINRNEIIRWNNDNDGTVTYALEQSHMRTVEQRRAVTITNVYPVTVTTLKQSQTALEQSHMHML